VVLFGARNHQFRTGAAVSWRAVIGLVRVVVFIARGGT
jgi:hypothetical protein